MATFSENQSVKLNKRAVDHLTPRDDAQRLVFDTVLKGFGVRVTSQGTKTFIVDKRVNGKRRRITLGRYGALTVEQARKLAQKTLGDMAMNIDPVAEKKKRLAYGITLKKAFEDFLKARKHLKPHTRYDYERIMNRVFGTWFSKPITAITRTMVVQRFQNATNENGEHYANFAFRTLRAVLNFARAQYDDGGNLPILPNNPVSVLTDTHAWHRMRRRQTVIKIYQLPAWFAAVRTLKAPDQPITHETVADFLLLLLFTGLRKTEGLTLQWSQVDLQDKTLFIPDPKNHVPHRLPLPPFLVDLLKRRKAEALNAYVFPGLDGVGHLVEPKRQVQKVIELSGVPFILHDLRRTFITVAESLDISAYAVKRLVNHKMTNDVTAGYIVSDVERLRAPMHRISDFLLKSAKVKDSAKIVPLTPSASHADVISI